MNTWIKVGSGLLLFALAACGGEVADPGEVPQGDAPPANDAMVADWDDSSKVLELDEGWTVAACEGDAPILCVTKEGVPQGGVEATRYELGSIPGVDPGADAETQLRALAQDFHDAFSTDRADGCGADYIFEPIEPQPFVLANMPGLAFGFVGTMPDGRPSELNLQYAVVVEGQVVAITAIAYDDGGCPGRDDLGGFNSAALAAFRPHLEDVLHESPLPPLSD